MPSTLRSPPLLGYNERLHAIFSPDPPGTSRPRTGSGSIRPRIRSRAQVSPVHSPRSLSRGRPVSSWYRPRRFATSSDPYFEPDPNPRCSAPPIIIPDCDVSNLSQPSVDRAEDDSASSTTLVPGIDLEYEQQLSPVAREILNFIDSVPDYTFEMEAAAVVRNYRLNLTLAVSVWEEELFQNSNPQETTSSELAENVRTAKEWKDKILRAQVECESVPELQELRT